MGHEELLNFLQTSAFLAQWSKRGLTDADLRELELSIMAGPMSAPVIAGTHGVRKVRFSPSREGRGKLGAFRVFYVVFPTHGLVGLLAVLAKNERENFSKAERNAIGSVVLAIQKSLDTGEIQ